MEKVIRTVQPPHEGGSITLEQATRAWQAVEARRKAARQERKEPLPRPADAPR
jgi:hypothetical protein